MSILKHKKGMVYLELKELWIHVNSLPLPKEISSNSLLCVQRIRGKQEFYYMEEVNVNDVYPEYLFFVPATTPQELYNHLIVVQQKDWIVKRLEERNLEAEPLTISCFCFLYMLSEAYLYSIMPEETIQKYLDIEYENLIHYRNQNHSYLQLIEFQKNFPLEKMRLEFVWDYMKYFYKEKTPLSIVKSIRNFFFD